MDGQPFRGSWNRLPFSRRNAITASWLRKADEQLPDRELGWQTLRRLLLLHALGQRWRYRARIPPSAARILWLHQSDHVGDSLMRLSSIRLLEGRQVDLLASVKAVDLFEPGGVFRNLFTLGRDDVAAVANPYDLVILDALQTKPLLAKQRLFRSTPFVSQNDFFHYCRDDYNLTLFSWYRMAYLLGLGDAEDLERQARLTMEFGAATGAGPALGVREGSVAIALGGREDYRIYRVWDEVARLLLAQRPDLGLVLLGTDNAAHLAQRITSEHGEENIVNGVDRLSLRECAAVVSRCRLLLCADGGLLHVANAVGTPTVGLFAQEFPDLRYVPADRFRALRSEMDVNELPAAAVVRETMLALDGQWQTWQMAARAGGGASWQ